MNRVRILRSRPSTGARALAREMGVRMIRLRGSRFAPRERDRVINWGGTAAPWDEGMGVYVNSPSRVELAVDKMLALSILTDAGVPTLEWTTDREEALQWASEDHGVVCRTMLRASSGRGIVLVPPGSRSSGHWDGGLVQAPLYTKYFKGLHEYRIHVVGGSIIDRAQKRRRRDAPEVVTGGCSAGRTSPRWILWTTQHSARCRPSA
jgi:hypothetical protein